MYSKVAIDDVDEMEPPVEGNDATVVPVGYMMDIEESRPNLWRYEAGESTSLHRHSDQEELYHILEGELTLEIGESPEDLETVDIETGDVFAVEPAAWRRLVAETDATVFAVGAPNVPNDHEIHGA